MTNGEYWYEFQRLENVRREIELMLGLMLLEAFREVYPKGVRYEFEVFDSDNGDDDWEYPVAVNLWCEALTVTKDDPLYALCDATADTPSAQAQFLLKQLIAEGNERGVILN